jgi:hypothetical protein
MQEIKELPKNGVGESGSTGLRNALVFLNGSSIKERYKR